MCGRMVSGMIGINMLKMCNAVVVEPGPVKWGHMLPQWNRCLCVLWHGQVVSNFLLIFLLFFFLFLYMCLIRSDVVTAGFLFLFLLLHLLILFLILIRAIC